MIPRQQESLERFGNVIELIYEGATDPTRWTHDILPQITSYVGASKCVMYTPFRPPHDGGFCFLHGVPQESLERRMTSFQHEDVWTNAAAERHVFIEGAVVASTELVPQQELVQTRFYREFLARDGILHGLFCIIFGAAASVTAVVCSFFRGPSEPDFDEKDRTRARLLLPHLSKSLGVMHRINALQLALSATQAALDRLDGGVLLLDSAGEVSFANRAALRMLASADGLRLAKESDTGGRGILHADNRLANHSLVAAIQSTLSRQSLDVDHFSHGVVIPRASGKKSYLLEFSALGNSHEFGPPQDAAVIAFLSDCERQRTVEPQVLRELYGLTRAEAKTALALLDCGSARELAEFLGVSVHTVRTQIKNIYGKMSVDSRGRFVRLMMGLVSR